jgi:hypothetical protein
MSSITKQQLLLSLKSLRKDGIFVKEIEFLDETHYAFNLTLANYITDMDDGKAIECLYEKEEEGEGEFCLECVSITRGINNDKNCVPCPFCGVPTKPHALKERLYTSRFTVTLQEGVSVIMDGTTPKEMLERVSANFNEMIRQKPQPPPKLDLSGGFPSYGFTIREHGFLE